MSSYANKPAAQSALKTLLDANSIYGVPVSNIIYKFLTEINTGNYTSLSNTIVDVSFNSFSNGERFLLSIDDGTVAFDTSKTTLVNTYVSFNSKEINENHNTRPEILLATLSSSGIGVSRRYSSSVGNYLQYAAERFGNSTEQNLGTARMSYPEA